MNTEPGAGSATRHSPTLEQIKEAATRYGRCCDQYQDGLGTFHCYECGQATFAMLSEVQDLLGVHQKDGKPLTDAEHVERHRKAAERQLATRHHDAMRNLLERLTLTLDELRSYDYGEAMRIANEARVLLSQLDKEGK